MFTKELIKEIEYKLSLRAKKDTLFEEALPLSGEEQLAIILGNKNKKLPIKDIAQGIYDYSIGGIINITDKYGKENITLQEALILVDKKIRKKGQFISFLDTDNNWKLYQFKSNNIKYWEDINYWDDFNINQYIDSILPDELDLTKILFGDNFLLQFKNKLNNNLLGLSIIWVRPGTLDFSTPNAIYIIRYNYDLYDKTIAIPKNSILYILGGSLTNGTLVGNNTNLIFKNGNSFSNVSFKGTWNSSLYTIYENSVVEIDLNELKYKIDNNVLNDNSINLEHLSEELILWIKDNSIFTDGEDLVRGLSGEILFSDKKLDEDSFSGKGRVYIRKNIVDGENILRLKQFNQLKTIYINQYDFTLLNRTIKIPQGSILINYGGSFSEGVLLFGYNSKLIDFGNILGELLDIEGNVEILSSIDCLNGKIVFESIINKNEW